MIGPLFAVAFTCCYPVSAYHVLSETLDSDVWIVDMEFSALESTISDNAPPSFTKVMGTRFEATGIDDKNIANSYGQRARGFLVPEVSGSYTFWMTADDAGEFWLSTDTNENNAVLRTSCTYPTTKGSYGSTDGQKSNPVYLESGNAYYMEIIHLEFGGDDFVSVAWHTDSSHSPTEADIIPASVLSSYSRGAEHALAYGPTRTLDRSYWESLSGSITSIDDLKGMTSYVQDQPTGSDLVGRGARLHSWAVRLLYPDSDYGQRIRGYIVPTTSASYTFWLNADDETKVYLSTDSDPNNAGDPLIHEPIYAEEYVYTRKSSARPLEANQAYYIEIVHLKSCCGDFFNLAWRADSQTPSKSDIIPASVLHAYSEGWPSPTFTTTATTTTTVSTTSSTSSSSSVTTTSSSSTTMTSSSTTSSTFSSSSSSTTTSSSSSSSSTSTSSTSSTSSTTTSTSTSSSSSSSTTTTTTTSSSTSSSSTTTSTSSSSSSSTSATTTTSSSTSSSTSTTTTSSSSSSSSSTTTTTSSSTSSSSSTTTTSSSSSSSTTTTTSSSTSSSTSTTTSSSSSATTTTSTSTSSSSSTTTTTSTSTSSSSSSTTTSSTSSTSTTTSVTSTSTSSSSSSSSSSTTSSSTTTPSPCSSHPPRELLPDVASGCFGALGPITSGDYCQPQCPFGLLANGSLLCDDGQYSLVSSVIHCLPETVCPDLTSLVWSLGTDFVQVSDGVLAMEPRSRSLGARWEVSCASPRTAAPTTGSVQTLRCVGSDWAVELPDGSTAVLGSSDGPALRCEDPNCQLPAAPPTGDLSCTDVDAETGEPKMWTVCHLACPAGYYPSRSDVELQCIYVSAADADYTLWSSTSTLEVYSRAEDQVPGDAVPAVVPFVRYTQTLQREVYDGVEQECEAVNCEGSLAAATSAVGSNGLNDVSCSGTTYGSVCVPICAYGWAPDPQAAAMVCSELGSFSGGVGCIRTVCSQQPVWPLAHPEAVSIADGCSGRLHGEVCAVHCATGYASNSSSSSSSSSSSMAFTCDNGAWAVQASAQDAMCQPVVCPSLPVVADSVVNETCAGLPSGAKCELTCLPRFSLNGDVVCQAGMWKTTGMGCMPGSSQATQSAEVLEFSLTAVQTPQASYQVENVPEAIAHLIAQGGVLGASVSSSTSVLAELGQELGRALTAAGNSAENTTLASFAAAVAEGYTCEQAVALATSASSAASQPPGRAGADVVEIALASDCEPRPVLEALARSAVSGLPSARRLQAGHALNTTDLLQRMLGGSDAASVRVQSQDWLDHENARQVGAFAANLTVSSKMTDEASDADLELMATRAREAALLGGWPLMQAEVLALYAAALLAGGEATVLAAAAEAVERHSALASSIDGLTTPSAVRRSELGALAAELATRLPNQPQHPLQLQLSAYAVAAAAGLSLIEAAQVACALGLQVRCAEDSSAACTASAAAVLGRAVRVRQGLAGEAAEAAALAASAAGRTSSAHIVAAAAGASARFGPKMAMVVVPKAVAAVGVATPSQTQLQAAISLALSSPRACLLAADALGNSSVSAALLGGVAVVATGTTSVTEAVEATSWAVRQRTTSASAATVARAAATMVVLRSATLTDIGRAEAAVVGLAQGGEVLSAESIGLGIGAALSGESRIARCAAAFPVAMETGLNRTDASLAALVALGASPAEISQLTSLVQTSSNGSTWQSLRDVLRDLSEPEDDLLAAATVGAAGLRLGLSYAETVLAVAVRVALRPAWQILNVTGALSLCMGASAEDYARALGRLNQEQTMIPGVTSPLVLASFSTAAAGAAFGLQAESVVLIDAARAVVVEATHSSSQSPGLSTLLQLVHWDLAPTRMVTAAYLNQAQAASSGSTTTAAVASYLAAGWGQNLRADAASLAAAQVLAQDGDVAWAVHLTGLLAAGQPLRPARWPRTATGAAKTATEAALAGEMLRTALQAEEGEACGSQGSDTVLCPGTCAVLRVQPNSSCQEFCVSRSTWSKPQRCTQAGEGTTCGVDQLHGGGCGDLWSSGQVCKCSGAEQGARMAAAAAVSFSRVLEDGEAVRQLSSIFLPYFAQPDLWHLVSDYASATSDLTSLGDYLSQALTGLGISLGPADAQGLAYLPLRLLGLLGPGDSSAAASSVRVGMEWGLSPTEAAQGMMDLLWLEEPSLPSLLNRTFVLAAQTLEAAFLPRVLADLALRANDLEEILGPSAIWPQEPVPPNAYVAAKTVAGDLQLGGTLLGQTIAAAAVAAASSLTPSQLSGLSYTATINAGAPPSVASEAAFAAALQAGASPVEATQALASTLRSTGAGEVEVMEEVVRAARAAGSALAEAEVLTAASPGGLGRSAQYAWQPLAPEWTSKATSAQAGATISAEWVLAHRSATMTAMARALGLDEEQVLVESASDLQAARTQQGLSIGFLLRTRPGDDVAAAEEKIRQLANVSSQVFRTYVQELGQLLESEGVEVPGGLSGLSLAPSAVLQQEDYPMPISSWTIMSEWGSCGTTCGEATQQRSVSCNTGNVAACDAMGTKPAGTQACEDYSECPFSMDCPLGKGNGMECAQQMAVIWGSSSTPLLCLLAWICLICRRRCRPVPGGAEKVGNEVINWRREAPPGEKVHIVWDIDVLKIQTSSKTDQLPDVENAVETAFTDEALQEVTAKDSMPSAGSQKHGSPPLDPGERLEYFSSHGAWLPAIVKGVRFRGANNVSVDVKLPRNRLVMRSGVPLWLLRAPLGAGEFVDLYSFRHERFLRAVTAGPARYSTSIRLLDKPDQNCPTSIENVPPDRLRRRFPPGTPIEFYDCLNGWQRGVVVGEYKPEGSSTPSVQEATQEQRRDGSAQLPKSSQEAALISHASSSSVSEVKSLGGDPLASAESPEAEEDMSDLADQLTMSSRGRLTGRSYNIQPSQFCTEYESIFEERASTGLSNLDVAGLHTVSSSNLSLCRLFCSEFGYAGFLVQGEVAVLFPDGVKGRLCQQPSSTCFIAVSRRPLFRPTCAISGNFPEDEWFEVPVEIQVGENAVVKAVPSYLIRLPAAFKEQLAQAMLAASVNIPELI